MPYADRGNGPQPTSGLNVFDFVKVGNAVVHPPVIAFEMVALEVLITMQAGQSGQCSRIAAQKPAGDFLAHKAGVIYCHGHT